MAATRGAAAAERQVYAKIARRLMPILTVSYVLNYLDRNNIAFAALRMNQHLGLTPTEFGVGAGVLFLGYCAFEIPSNGAHHDHVGAAVGGDGLRHRAAVADCGRAVPRARQARAGAEAARGPAPASGVHRPAGAAAGGDPVRIPGRVVRHRHLAAADAEDRPAVEHRNRCADERHLRGGQRGDDSVGGGTSIAMAERSVTWRCRASCRPPDSGRGAARRCVLVVGGGGGGGGGARRHERRARCSGACRRGS